MLRDTMSGKLLDPEVAIVSIAIVTVAIVTVAIVMVAIVSCSTPRLVLTMSRVRLHAPYLPPPQVAACSRRARGKESAAAIEATCRTQRRLQALN